MSTNDPTVPWLLYDRKQIHRVTVAAADIPPHVSHIMADLPKAFFYANWTGTEWKIGNKVQIDLRW
jgi:hypothetical protein